MSCIIGINIFGNILLVKPRMNSKCTHLQVGIVKAEKMDTSKYLKRKSRKSRRRKLLHWCLTVFSTYLILSKQTFPEISVVFCMKHSVLLKEKVQKFSFAHWDRNFPIIYVQVKKRNKTMEKYTEE